MPPAKQNCSMCGKDVYGKRLYSHKMMCHRRLSKTGDRLVDMIVTFIRTFDYSQCGANLHDIIPCLHAGGYTIGEIHAAIKELEDDSCVFRLYQDEDYYQFNYGCMLIGTGAEEIMGVDSVDSSLS